MPSKRKPTKVVIDQFFIPSEPWNEHVTSDPNCTACGAHVLPHMQVTHVEWHLRLTKLFESKRDKL